METSSVPLLVLGTVVLLLLSHLLRKKAAPAPPCSRSALENCIYAGTVTHTRYNPTRHGFQYTLYMMYTELGSDAEGAFDRFWFWSSRPGAKSLASLDPRAYLSVSQVQALVQQELGVDGIERVFLLTHWKYFGLQFNPVSYYYCFSSTGAALAMISEVHNTPWGEKCHYVHPCTLHSTVPGQRQLFEDQKRKKMHVSPFFGMDYTYNLQFTLPESSLSVKWTMTSEDEKRRDFTANMVLQPVPITQANLLWILVAYPWMTAKVVLMIYWQAVKLYLKVPFVSHPKYGAKSAAEM